ncbi:MAG: lipid-A-disaccharide synthase [Gammaproteobacteria bacterium]|nr:lipid-A-disaccharide synthase [Gammaproteobacteria bacterium]
MKRVMIIAGEASGDLHAAKLVKAVTAQRPDIHFYGIGGEDMREAGVEVMVDAAELAVVGLVEIWAHRKVIFGALHTMQDEISRQPPDLLVLVDYPEFNLRLAKTAKAHGVKVLYYISPQVWAWRQHRVKKIRKRVDMMAVVFPFEETFYQAHQVPVEFVGHPLVDEVKPSADRDSLRAEFKLEREHPVIGLFPGSRRSEIKRLLDIILQSAQCLQQNHPTAQFLLPLAPGLKHADLQPYLQQYPDLPIQVIEDRAYDVMAACDVIITVSGTVTLEIALVGTPLLIINKVAWLTYRIVHRMLKIKHIGLCNIVADKRIAPELIQHDATPEKICRTVTNLLEHPEEQERMRQELGRIENLLGKKGGIDNTARLVTRMVGE